MPTTRLGYLLGGLLVLLAGRAVGQARAGSRPLPPAPPVLEVPLNEGVAVAGPVPPGRGLLATYYPGLPQGPAVSHRVETAPWVTWWGISPAPGVSRWGFGVRWAGYMRAPETGVYVLHFKWGGATEAYMAEQQEQNEDKSGHLDVTQHYEAGYFYRIELAYEDAQGVPEAILCWSLPSEMGHPRTSKEAFAAHDALPLTAIAPRFLYPGLPQPVVLAARAVPVTRPVTRPVAAARPVPVTRPVVVARPPAVVARPRPVRPRPVAPPPVAPGLLPNLATLHRGTAVALPNLYFARESTAELLPISRPMLEALAHELRQQPALRLQLVGHTDNIGDAGRNLRLSQQRAGRVRAYLVQQGIDSLRLTTQGYGGTRPVADNRDPQQRPRNRRVEVVVQ